MEINEEIKIAVRFLSNEIRSDAIKIIIHKRKCITFNNCKINTIENNTNKEIKVCNFEKSSSIRKEDLEKLKKKTLIFIFKNF